MGGEAGRIRHGHPRPAQGPLERSPEVPMAGETGAAALGVFHPEPLHWRRMLLRLGARRRHEAERNLQRPLLLHHWLASYFWPFGLTSGANSESLGQIGDWGQRKQRATSRANLNGGVQLRTNPALEAWCPAAIVDLDLIQGVLPVLPQPLPIQAGIQVIPGQHLGVVALAGGVPVKIDSAAIQASLGATSPALVREVLAPAVESAAIPPNCFD